MYYFLLILLFSIILLIVCGYYKRKICRVIKAPVVCPPLDNALKSASVIGHFLNERCVATGGGTLAPKSETGINAHRLANIMLGKEMAIAEFIRLCHSVGCEVVIRQIGTDDLEVSENTPKVFAQEMSRIEDEYWNKSMGRTGKYY